MVHILLHFLNFYDKHSDFQKQFNMYIYNWITLLYNWNNIQSKQTEKGEIVSIVKVIWASQVVWW